MPFHLQIARTLLAGSCFVATVATAQTPAAPAASPAPAQTPATAALPPRQQAWELLRSGAHSQKTEERATAVRVLSLLRGQREAVGMAREALGDGKPQVRTAAAMALGELGARSAIPQLKQTLEDKEIPVVLAAAHALLLMRDPSAYEVYYAILTGKRKSNQGLVASQIDELKDTKKMALLGFEEGIGFVPFASIGYSAVRTIMKDDSSPVRAAAARVLAADPDPATTQGLSDEATADKSELVRTAALEALARHGDPAYIDKIVPAMSDHKDSVRYTAAAAIVRLSAIAARRERQQEKK